MLITYIIIIIIIIMCVTKSMYCIAISGVRYTNFSYHDIGAITITI